MDIYINSIKYNRSLVDGPGVRTVVFLQGCDLHCKGCQNLSTWDMEKGEKISTVELANLLIKNVVNNKVTFSGGEPLMQYESLLDTIKRLTNFDIAVYTGHKIEEVPQELLDNIKYIKTGKFELSLKTTTMPYIGSSNQQFRSLR